MANQEHLDILMQGVDVWDKWRLEHQGIQPDLSGADLDEANLRRAYLKGANLKGTSLKKVKLEGANLRRAILNGADLRSAYLNDAYLKGADLTRVNLSEARLIRTYLGEAKLIGADLRRAYLNEANFSGSDLSEANLSEADLMGANLTDADFSKANLSAACLNSTILVRTNLEGANLTGCNIHGVSAWNIKLRDAIQSNLIITDLDEPTITLDNLKVAQFIYLLLNNEELRDVIDTITSKVVLILGRFTLERKAILDALRDELRKHDYLPVMFDFDRPESRDFTETARTLAHLSRFIIADITEPSSIPQELQAIVPDLEVPVQPLLEEARKQYAMFPDLRKYSWVFPVYHYEDQVSLIASLKKEIIEPADKKARELAIEKAKRLGKL